MGEKLESDENHSEATTKSGTLTRTLAACLLFGGWSLFLTPWIRFQFWQPDTFWLIETGRYILEKHSLPARDVFSFTSKADHWTIYQWLSEVFFSLANSIGGLTGVAIFGSVLLAFLFCFLIFRSMLEEQTRPPAAFAAIWLCAYSFFPYLSSLRPQLISFVLFWLLLKVCRAAKNSAGKTKTLTQTFLIALLWANCHISFPIGVLILVINCAAAFVTKHSDRRLSAQMLALFLIGTSFNPYGFSLWPFLLTLQNITPTPELQPVPWAASPQLVLIAGSCLFAYWYRRKKLAISDFLTAAALVFIGSNCSRLMVYFWIYCCPVLGAAMSDLWGSRIKQKNMAALSQAMRTLAMSKFYVIAILLLAICAAVSQPVYLRPNIPVQAALFLEGSGKPGNLFCDAQSGSYLIYKSQGSIPVFLDTRLDLYDPEFVFRFSKALNEGDQWQTLFDQFKIQRALIPKSRPLCGILTTSKQWNSVYQDSDFAVFERIP